MVHSSEMILVLQNVFCNFWLVAEEFGEVGNQNLFDFASSKELKKNYSHSIVAGGLLDIS